MRLRNVLSVLVVGLGVVSVSADLSAKKEASWFIIKDDAVQEGSVEVAVGDFQCTFHYTFGLAGETVTPEVGVEAKEEDASAVLEGLNAGPCTETRIAGSGTPFKYKVCPGRSVEQINGADVFSLGKMESSDGNTQTFTGGTMCNAVRPPTGRKSTVEYVCGTKLAVSDVSESPTCVYSLTVTTPDGCGLKAFERAPRHHAPRPSHVDRPWRMEIEEIGEGRVACTVHVVDDLKVGGFSAAEDDAPLNSLRTFSLSIGRTDTGGNAAFTGHSHSQPLQAVTHALRSANRVPFPSSHVQLHQPDGMGVPVSVSASQSFKPVPAEYLHLVVYDVDAEMEEDQR